MPTRMSQVTAGMAGLTLGLFLWAGCGGQAERTAPPTTTDSPTVEASQEESSQENTAEAMPSPAPPPSAGAEPELAVSRSLAMPEVSQVLPEAATGEGSPLAPPVVDDSSSDETDDYTTVTVYYGTDRKPVENTGASDKDYVNWLASLGSSVTLMIIFGTLAVRWWKRRLRLALMGLGCLMSAAATGVVMLLVPSAEPPVLGRAYGNDRGPVELGTCQITIPKQHKFGQMERPSIFHLEFQEDPTKHVILRSVTPEPADSFYAMLRAHVENAPRKEAFVFVHGYNVTFEAAARRTAQMAHDLKFEGAPIFFSWPSQGELLGYTVDETNVVWTVPHLKEFLLDIAHRSGAQSVHLMAHSMGNRALTAALQSMTYEIKDELPKYRHVVLAAPDIDAEIFRRDIAPSVVRTADRVTLYASSKDEALVASKEVHGYPRAGDSGEGLLLMSGIDTIDVSAIDSSLLGHSYYGDNRTVLEDLWGLLNQSRPPSQRPWLQPIQLGPLMYWVFSLESSPVETAGRPQEGNR